MKLSMNKQFMLLQVPLLAVGLTVGLTVSVFALQTGETLKAHSEIQEVNQLALKSSIYVAEMGSAVKGYLLDPNNELEATRKKEADDKNADAIKKC